MMVMVMVMMIIVIAMEGGSNVVTVIAMMVGTMRCPHRWCVFPLEATHLWLIWMEGSL